MSLHPVKRMMTSTRKATVSALLMTGRIHAKRREWMDFLQSARGIASFLFHLEVGILAVRALDFCVDTLQAI